MNNEQRAAAGSMTSFADASTLVDKLGRAENKGDMLVAVLAYRREVRAELLDALRTPASWKGAGLPPVGADVLFDTGSSGEQVGTVTGYEVRSAGSQSTDTYRVDVFLVYKGTSTPNCRGLQDLRPVPAGYVAQKEASASDTDTPDSAVASSGADTDEPLIDGWPLYSGLPPAASAVQASLDSPRQDNGAMKQEPLNPTYPGHPLTIAVQVMRAYPSLEAATRREEPTAYPNALRDSAIRGAGGNVYAALDLLKHTLAGHVELAVADADKYWRCTAEPFGAERCEDGAHQAALLRSEFDERVSQWRSA